jgi:hypothetical protein
MKSRRFIAFLPVWMSGHFDPFWERILRKEVQFDIAVQRAALDRKSQYIHCRSADSVAKLYDDPTRPVKLSIGRSAASAQQIAQTG